MKKFLLFALLAFVMCACGGNQNKGPITDESIWDIPVEEDVDTAAIREKAVKWMKEGGAVDAYIDEDGYLVYVENPSKISADPNEVAKLYYEMFEGDLVIGVKIVSSISNEVIGKY